MGKISKAEKRGGGIRCFIIISNTLPDKIEKFEACYIYNH